MNTPKTDAQQGGETAPWRVTNQIQHDHLGDYCTLGTAIRVDDGEISIAQRIPDTAEGYAKGKARIELIVEAVNERASLQSQLETLRGELKWHAHTLSVFSANVPDEATVDRTYISGRLSEANKLCGTNEAIRPFEDLPFITSLRSQLADAQKEVAQQQERIKELEAGMLTRDKIQETHEEELRRYRMADQEQEGLINDLCYVLKWCRQSMLGRVKPDDPAWDKSKTVLARADALAKAGLAQHLAETSRKLGY